MRVKTPIALKYAMLKIEHDLLLQRLQDKVFDRILEMADQDDLIAMKEQEIKKLRKQVKYYKDLLKEK